MEAIINVYGLGLEAWDFVVAGLAIGLSLITSAHAVLHKRDPRAAIAWVGFIWFLPVFGAALYGIFGINRIRRRAAILRENAGRFQAQPVSVECSPEDLCRHLPNHLRYLNMLARLAGRVIQRPLQPGNRIEPLVNGDEAFPAMLAAIGQARQSVTLLAYIFDDDEIGLAFARALGEAVRRGVQVRVLIDAAGVRYSWPSILPDLRRQGVPFARFLPAWRVWRLLSINLRTHRKILVVDGRLGFTGGMNLRLGHCLLRRPQHPVQDIHFQIEGPVVVQLQEAFADDWRFATGESLRGETWFPPLERVGLVLARGVVDGPDEDFEKLRWTLLGALAIARSSVRVATPYFLPDQALISALSLAAMRGVRVDILLPERNNLPLVQWASRSMWWQVLEHGCRLWLTPPPFDHSKLMVVDGCWVLLGSANWDPRSLRLNFEFNLECYDPQLGQRLEALIERKRVQARAVTLAEVDGRSLPARLRDGLARLLTPYL